jgi:serine/threonine protein kinase
MHQTNVLRVADREVAADPVALSANWKIDTSSISENQQAIFETAKSTLFRAAIRADRRPVMLWRIFELNEAHLEVAKQELMLLTTLAHPTLAPVLGGSTNGGISVIYDHPRDLILSSALHGPTPIAPVDLARIAYGIARGMNYLHSRRVLHGSLSCSSVLIDDQLDVKLWNFGFQVNEVDERLMPPEFIELSVYSAKSDVYQYGLLLWEMVRKKQPFLGEPIGALRIAITQQQFRPEIDDSCPSGLRKLMEECWSQSPDIRSGPPPLRDRDRLLLSNKCRGRREVLRARKTGPVGSAEDQ